MTRSPWDELPGGLPAMRREGVYGDRVVRCFAERPASLHALLKRAGLPESTFAAFRVALEVCHEVGFADSMGTAARLRRKMVERVLTACESDSEATEALLILLRRFATESAREEARMFCDELVAEASVAPLSHELIAA